MGACCAGASGSSAKKANDAEGGLLARGELPVSKPWRSRTPITRAELEAKREMYWDTQPHFGGTREIWDALKSVLPLPTDEAMAVAVLQAAEIRFPSNSWGEVYDSRGYRYELPEYVVTDPTNLDEA